MSRTSRYSPDVKERAVRMVVEHEGEYGSRWAAVKLAIYVRMRVCIEISRCVSLSVLSLWLVGIILACSVLGCTTSVMIPPSEYDAPGRGLMFRIHTVGDCTYFASGFCTTDSTVVVTGLRQPPSDPVGGMCGTPATPFELNLKDVASIEKVEESVGLPIVIGVFTAAFIALAVATGLPWGN